MRSRGGGVRRARSFKRVPFFSRNVLDYAEKHYAKYFTAPEKWTDQPSLSSLEHYARQQKPAPAKP